MKRRHASPHKGSPRFRKVLKSDLKKVQLCLGWRAHTVPVRQFPPPAERSPYLSGHLKARRSPRFFFCLFSGMFTHPEFARFLSVVAILLCSTAFMTTRPARAPRCPRGSPCANHHYLNLHASSPYPITLTLTRAYHHANRVCSLLAVPLQSGRTIKTIN